MEDQIKAVFTDSTAISGFTYDKLSKILSVKFNHGGVYDYPGVPEKDVTAWTTAESKGKYFNQVIKKYSVNA